MGDDAVLPLTALYTLIFRYRLWGRPVQTRRGDISLAVTRPQFCSSSFEDSVSRKSSPPLFSLRARTHESLQLSLHQLQSNCDNTAATMGKHARIHGWNHYAMEGNRMLID